MTPAKLAKIKRELDALYASPRGLKSSDLSSLAVKLGRTKSKRGKEPTYVREDIPLLSPPLSIPKHSKDMPPGTARNVIEGLLSDVDEWEIHLQTLENCNEPEGDEGE